MGIIDKIKSRFKKEAPEEKRPPKEIPESKLKGIKIYAPDVEMDEQNRKKFYVSVYDKDNKLITDENILIGINNVFYKKLPEENGAASLSINLKPKEYIISAKYPDEDDYAPEVYSNVVVFKNNETENNVNFTETTKLYAPSMKIYKNEEPNYTVRLTDKDENPIAGEEVTITIGETERVEKTDENGFISFFEKYEIGTYPIKAEFKGNEEHDPVIKEGELEVLERIIDRDVMIEVKNLVMEFKVSKDKIDTLKEYIIRTLKRNKTEKQKIRVLDDISFNVYKGERLGILGFNGAGKSTLLKIITGIYEPTSGEINTYGKIAPLLELGAGFDKNYTGENNIYLNGAFLSMTEDFIDEKYDEIVEYSELGEFIKYPVKNYSSGMRSKLGFSIATLIDPDILIVDEILSVGDIKFRKKSAAKIKSLMEDGATVLLVTHSIKQVKDICDRCIWLEDGKIVMEGNAKDVCNAYKKSARTTKNKKKKKKNKKKTKAKAKSKEKTEEKIATEAKKTIEKQAEKIATEAKKTIEKQAEKIATEAKKAIDIQTEEEIATEAKKAIDIQTEEIINKAKKTIERKSEEIIIEAKKQTEEKIATEDETDALKNTVPIKDLEAANKLRNKEIQGRILNKNR